MSLFLILSLFLFATSSVCTAQTENTSDEGRLRFTETGSMDPGQVPLPPDMPWKFYEDMRKPLWSDHGWTQRPAATSQADLSQGVTLKLSFPDPKERLQTACDDLRKFFNAGHVPIKDRGYLIELVYDKTLIGEAFRIETDRNLSQIHAGDIEGIRRGIFSLEDEMLRNEGPFLTLGTMKRTPFIKRRISRCFFSPIKRPGNHPGPMRDELTDNIDYYPDEYLNRMAHEGVNGLWLTVSSKDGAGQSTGFVDLVATSVTPDAGKDGKRRLEKLNRTVQKCLKYGIRTYIKIMEPAIIIKPGDPLLQRYPDARGTSVGNLCAGSEAGQKYLRESLHAIFTAVPELGGLINISHGELYTTCLSSLPATGGGKINCPHCSKLPPWKILYESLSAMEQGVHSANPDAEIISWLYMPQPANQDADTTNKLADWVYDIADHIPPGVILQFNFESGVEKEYFGKTLIGGDYWLGIPGPSDRFVKIATRARAKNTSVSAKIQTGASYTMATVPHVPVPSLLYDKFAAMRELGVEYVMLNWIIGAAPGLMNKAAGELSFEPFPKSQAEFLERLAALSWHKQDRETVTKAWQLFAEGYSNIPLSNLFQYYGPLNDGIVWPLLLKPEYLPLTPTYQLGMRGEPFRPWPPSGDLVRECCPQLLSLDEVVELARRMNTSWHSGVELLKTIQPAYQTCPERLGDIHLAQAQGLLFEAAYDIFLFYRLREDWIRGFDSEPEKTLDSMRQLVEHQRAGTEQMLTFWRENTMLGFNADAEGYKFYPDKLNWRIRQLDYLLQTEIPAVKKRLRQGQPPYPEFLAESVKAIRLADDFWNVPASKIARPGSLDWREFSPVLASPKRPGQAVKWSCAVSSDDLYIFLNYKTKTPKQSKNLTPQTLSLTVERVPLDQGKTIHIPLITKENEGNLKRLFPSNKSEQTWVVRIPLSELGDTWRSYKLQRLNVQVKHLEGTCVSWRPSHPLPPRLVLPRVNPKDLGWILLPGPTRAVPFAANRTSPQAVIK